MSVDISAILPVAMGQSDSRSLNDDFAATTPSGDSVFSKPLGDKCVWKTPNGSVSVAFFFDPKQKFGRHNILASVSNDYMSDIRDQLTKMLLDEKDIASKTKTYEETYWDTITSTLPKETLAKNIFSKPEQLKEYTDLLTKNVKASFNEEELITKALQTRNFNFAYEMAIDAYPQQLRGKKPAPGEKLGVLTIHIQGVEGENEATAEEKKESDTTKAEDSTSGTSNSNAIVVKKRKLDNGSAAGEPSERAKILKELGIAEGLKSASVFSVKEFPLTASQFFDAVGRWFGSTVSTSAGKLEKARNRNPIYQ